MNTVRELEAAVSKLSRPELEEFRAWFEKHVEGQSQAAPGLTARNQPVAGPNQLTPEEQMAAFEKDLKENDWGHQPC